MDRILHQWYDYETPTYNSIKSAINFDDIIKWVYKIASSIKLGHVALEEYQNGGNSTCGLNHLPYCMPIAFLIQLLKVTPSGLISFSIFC